MPSNQQKLDPYKVEQYAPDYSNCAELQTHATASMKMVGTRVKAAFITLTVSFFLFAGILIVFKWLPAFFIMMTIMSICLIYSAYYFIPKKAPDCPSCHQRMKTDWIIIGGKSAKFLVCDACKLFVDSLWRGR